LNSEHIGAEFFGPQAFGYAAKDTSNCRRNLGAKPIYRYLAQGQDRLVSASELWLHSEILQLPELLHPKVDEIKSDMDILKEQLYANHQDIEAFAARYRHCGY
jgi:hypothetical protein